MKPFCFFTFLFCLNVAQCQQLYIVPYIDNQLIGISNIKKRTDLPEDFKKTNLHYLPTLGFNIIKKSKKYRHIFGVEYSSLGTTFKITNKYNTPSAQLGHLRFVNHGSFEYLQLSYSLGREVKNFNGFLFQSKIKFNFALGLALAFNAGKLHYENPMNNYFSYFSINPTTYLKYEKFTNRTGEGLLLSLQTGFDIFSKNSKRILSLNLYGNLGLIYMQRLMVNYEYGYNNDPTKKVKVEGLILHNNATAIGLKVGVPIQLKK